MGRRRIRNRQRLPVTSTGEEKKRAPVNAVLQTKDMLISKWSQYQLQYFSFDGVSSRVARCQDLFTKDSVAIKIFNKRTNDSQEPSRELAMLKVICGIDPLNIVRFHDSFEHMGKTCLVFEMLDKSLYELLRERRGNPLSLQQIRPITEQPLLRLTYMKLIQLKKVQSVHPQTMKPQLFPTEAEIDKAGPAEESSAIDSVDLATSSTYSCKKPLKKTRRFFGRMFRAMCCCCCSAAVDE